MPAAEAEPPSTGALARGLSAHTITPSHHHTITCTYHRTPPYSIILHLLSHRSNAISRITPATQESTITRTRQLWPPPLLRLLLLLPLLLLLLITVAATTADPAAPPRYPPPPTPPPPPFSRRRPSRAQRVICC